MYIESHLQSAFCIVILHRNNLYEVMLPWSLFCYLTSICMCSIQSKFNYKYIICQQKLNSIYSNVIICFILTPFLTLPSQPVLSFPLKLQNFTTLIESLMSACGGRFGIFLTYVIESMELKLISVCLIDN